MYIKKLIIDNYKSIKNETFEFSKGINVLVGKNNAGKSNIVSALNEVLSDKYSTSDYEDKIFYTNDTDAIKREFMIVTEIEELENLDFEYLNNVKKSVGLIKINEFFSEENQNWNSEWIIKDDDELKERHEEKLSGRRNSEENILYWKKRDDLINLLNNTEKIWLYKYYNKDTDTNLLNIIIKEKKISGLAHNNYYRMVYVNQNVKSTFITSLLVPAFRSPETTLKISKWSWYGKLLQKKWNECYDKEAMQNIENAAQQLKLTLGEVYTDLKEQLNEQLSQALSLMNIKVDINMLENKKEDYYKNIRLYINDGVETPLENKGSGLQSLIIIELFKLYCKTFNKSSLLILEEPELFLHPHAKRMLSGILKDFLEINGILKNQVIVTTHAQEFVEDVDIENINVIKKGKDGTKKSRIDIEKYDFKELQKLKIELIYKNAEMFFADKVILVEGEEYILIPKIVEHVYGKNILNSKDISIIKVGGKSYFDIYRKVLNDLHIENYIIADYDIIYKELSSLIDEENIKKLNDLKREMPESLKSNKKVKNATDSLDWKKLVEVVEKSILNQKYNNDLEVVWSNFRKRIYEKVKLKDLDYELKNKMVDFIEMLYEKKIFIMKNGELEDYYKKENFNEDINKLSKGLKPYKIVELVSSGENIEKYICIDEYKEILSKMLIDIHL